MGLEQDRGQFHLESLDLFIRRAQVIAVTIFLFHILTSILDLIQLDLSFREIYFSRIPMAAVSLIIIVFVEKRWVSARLKPLLCLLLIFLMYNACVKSHQYGDQAPLIMLTLLVCITSASLIPWSYKYHIVIVIAAIGSVVYSLVDGGAMDGNEPLGREIVIIFSICLLSIYFSYITDNKRFLEWEARQRLQQNADIFRQMGDHMSDIVFLWNADFSIEYVSPAFELYTGRTVQDLLTTSLKVSDVIDPAQIQEYQQASQEVLDGHERRIDLRVVHIKGSEFHLEAWGKPIFGPDGKVARAVSIWRDVTARSAKEKALEHLAVQDSLTKVFNQRHFQNLASAEITKSLEQGAALTFLYVDIDNFRRITEQHGLIVGDQVIIEVIERCRMLLCNGQAVGRFGGDSWIVMLPDKTVEDASALAEQIASKITDQVILVEENLLSVTASIGVAGLDSERHKVFSDLLDALAKALYHSKRNGKNSVTVWSGA